MPPASHPALLVGPERFSDAGVVRLAADLALVQTVDFFAPIVDDPRDFGAIAAANSLSDVYAMGATPLTALNIVGFPDDELPLEILVAILEGGHHKVHEAGAVIVGGHTVRDTEVKYGLAVTGTVHPDRLVTNAGAQPGDVLVLTKPLGTGVITSAAKRRKAPADVLQAAVASMTRLNAAAAAAMLEAGVHAATDITGFGLLGQARAVAEASGVTLVVEAGRVPFLPATRELAARGHLTRAARSNAAFLADRVERLAGVDDLSMSLLHDAQTSGGLLLAVPEGRLAALLAGLERRSEPCRAVIGRVQAAATRAVIVQP